MKRSNSRTKAMMKLYSYEINKGVLPEEIDDVIFEEIGECDEKFSDFLYNGVLNNIDKIDDIISESLTNYKIYRLSYVDRQLIRIATFELMNDVNPKTIVINEAIELSKKYTQIDNYETSKFNNALLDNIAKYLNK